MLTLWYNNEFEAVSSNWKIDPNRNKISHPNITKHTVKIKVSKYPQVKLLTCDIEESLSIKNMLWNMKFIYMIV